MSKKKIRIWDRDFNLDVIYKTYSNQEPLASQIEAFVEFNEKVIDSAKSKVEKYVLKSKNINSVDNIFKYVVPKLIYIPQEEKKKVIAILCHYKFDPEHGMAIVFENNKLKEIGEEDIVL